MGARASSNSESERFTPGQSSTPTKDFKCHICDRVFTRKDNLKRHFKIHEDTFIKCSICPRLFNNQHDMEEHKLKHSSVLCSACGASFKKNCHLLEHQFTVHKVEGKTHHNFVCQISGCGKKFVRQAFLQSHMNVHINVKPYRCARCQNPFASQYACMRHERTCSTKSQITCKKCKRSFTSKDCLRVHIDSVHEKKLFPCTCGKLFVWRSGLSRHKASCDQNK